MVSAITDAAKEAYFSPDFNSCSVPTNRLDFPLKNVDASSEISISTHTDSIQAILTFFVQHEQEDLYIKGRDIAHTGQVMNIMTDGVFDIFASRLEGRAAVFEQIYQQTNLELGEIAIHAETGEGKQFPCKYYSGKALSEDFLASRVTANHLMSALGGVTVISLGSNQLNDAQLTERGEELVDHIWTRQTGQAVLLGTKTKPASQT